MQKPQSSRKLSDLCPCVRDKCERMLAACQSRGLAVVVVETLRNEAKQREYLAAGTSWTSNSKHLPQPPNMLSLAFDCAVVEYLDMKNWNPTGPLWDDLDMIAASVGLDGGVWRNRDGWLRNIDRPHYYLPKCECSKETVA